MVRIFAAILASACCGLSGSAWATDAPECRNGSFPLQEITFRLAKIVGAPRTYLRSDIAPCPDDSAACRGRVYVVPGDTVITGVPSGAYVCAFFPGRNGGSAGYVLQSEIVEQPPAASLPLAAWVGTWRDGDNSIALRADGARLIASGNAYWPSANPSPRYRPGGPNIGELDGSALPQGNIVAFGDDGPAECHVRLTLLPPFLLAADNKNCGGMNVSFTGVYRRR
jgi:hypothetical protein